MTLAVAPNLIERSDWAEGGLASVPDPTVLPENVLLDVNNLLPDEGGSGSLITRPGFARALEELTSDSGRYVISLGRLRANGTTFVIAVTTTGSTGANNVKIYAIDLSDMTAARIDTAGVEWQNPERPHVMMNVLEVLYGASPGNDWYSWDGTTWDDEAAVNSNWRTVVDDTDGGVDTDDEYGRDFAFRGKEHVLYNGKVFVPAVGIRFDKWSDDEDHYEKGERVSHQSAWGHSGTPKYWKSFRCIKAHNPDDFDAEPGVGADWRTYWQKVKLPLPQNAENETHEKWYLQPTPEGTDVAAWWADRFWLRADHVAGKDTLLFSAPLRPEKGEDIADLEFNFHDFAPGNDERGPGGGWIPVNDGRSTGIIEALHAYGQYLLVFKRQAVYAISGKSEETFTVRRLAKGVGAVGPEAVVEVDGLVYFLNDDGLYVTDGTSYEPVVNADYVGRDIEARIDEMRENLDGMEPQLGTYHDRIFIALPLAGEDDLTYVYDPKYQSWWKTDLPILCMTPQRYEGVPSLFFGAPLDYSGEDIVYALGGTTDDTGAGTLATQPIAWDMTTAWWVFGTQRQQRRIRKFWGLVTGAMTYTLTAYRDWASSSVLSTARTVAGSDSTYIEGGWFKDSHAVSFKLAGTAFAKVHSMAVLTEPRRDRYHTN